MPPSLLALALAAVADGGLAFEWVAPDACPQASSVRARLGAGLSGAMRAVVSLTPTGYAMTLDIDGSTRDLTASTCEEIADAAILIARLALVPARPAEPAALAPAALATGSPTSDLRWQLRAAALAAADFAWLPQPLFQLGGALELQWGPVGLVVDAVTALAQRYSGGPTADAAVDVRVPFALDAGLCWLFETDRLRAGPCLIGGPAWLTARGLNITDPRESSAVLWSGGAAGRLAVKFARVLEVSAQLGLRAGATPTVSFSGGPAVVQGSPLGVTVRLGAGVGL